MRSGPFRSGHEADGWHRIHPRSAHVAAQLYGQGFAGRPLVFLAGASYVEPILRWQITQQCFANVSLPLAGLGIGYQLHYLKNALTEQVAA